MTTATSIGSLKITRAQLSRFCPDEQTVRQFEKLFELVAESDPSSGGGGTVAQSFETVNKNLQAYPKTLYFTGADLTSVVYDLGASIITKTLTYAGDFLVSVVLSGETPSGISLTKTLTYSGDDLAAVTYS